MDEVTKARTPAVELTDLDTLEAESIHIIREVVAEFENPVMLFSGGKDSVLMLHLARKAFRPAPVPFPILHVDTGHNFPEVIEFRDRTAAEHGLRLEVASVQELIDAKAKGKKITFEKAPRRKAAADLGDALRASIRAAKERREAKEKDVA